VSPRTPPPFTTRPSRSQGGTRPCCRGGGWPSRFRWKTGSPATRATRSRQAVSCSLTSSPAACPSRAPARARLTLPAPHPLIMDLNPRLARLLPSPPAPGVLRPLPPRGRHTVTRRYTVASIAWAKHRPPPSRVARQASSSTTQGEVRGGMAVLWS